MFRWRRAIRRHVRSPTGATHQTLGGGVPFTVTCFNTCGEEGQSNGKSDLPLDYLSMHVLMLNILTEFTFFLREHSCLAHSLSRCCSRAPLKNTASSILLFWTVCMSTAKNCTIRFHCPPHTQSVKEGNHLRPGMDPNWKFSVIKCRDASLSLKKIIVTTYILITFI